MFHDGIDEELLRSKVQPGDVIFQIEDYEVENYLFNEIISILKDYTTQTRTVHFKRYNSCKEIHFYLIYS